MRFIHQPSVLPVTMAFLFAISCAMDAEQSGKATTATVYDFGAVGDGVADDTEALQQAVDARIGDVRLPRGVYRITRPIVIDLDKVGFTSVVGSGTAALCPSHPRDEALTDC